MSVFRILKRQITPFSTPKAFGAAQSSQSTFPRLQQYRSLKLSQFCSIPPKSRVLRIYRRQYSQKHSPKAQPNPTPHLNSPEPHSLTARLKRLSREYGWTVIGVYLALTVADFPFCFLAVKYIGAERVAYAEHVIVGGVKNIIQKVFPDAFQESAQQKVEAAEVSEDALSVENGEPTLWTQLALAFVIHKSFIFIRVPLTAAITPKVVRTLRGWGYDIGKRRPKSK